MKFKEGETRKFVTLTTQKIISKVPDQNNEETKLNILSQIGYTLAVEKVESDGSAVVKYTFDSIIIRQEDSTGLLVYDSSSPVYLLPKKLEAYAALVGQCLYFTLSPRGETKYLKGLDELVTKMVIKLGITESHPMRLTIEKEFKSKLETFGLTENLKTLSIFPEQPVRIGSSWKDKIMLTKGFPCIIDNAWKLKERKEGVAFIEVVSIIEPNPSAEPVNFMDQMMKFDISGSQKGTMEINEVTGWPNKQSIEQEMSGNVLLEGQNTAMPIEIRTRITTEEIK
ncbi:MAG: DUF6263 family protein [bacterium]|nr:DUF6263 family protein [bacterium]